MSFGTALKQAREAQGLTTQDLAARTKIRGDYLRALEDGHTNLLPERTFARSYLQRYARELNLDPAPLLAEFDRTMPVSAEIAQGMRNLSAPARDREAARERGARLSPGGLAALLTALIVIGAGGYWAFQTFVKPAPQPQVTPTTPTTTPAPTTPTTDSTPSAPTTPAATPAQPAPVTSVRLTVSSVPDGARVYLDNRDLGTTPLRSFPVDAREQAELRVEYAGRQSLKQTITLKEGRNLRARLLPPGQGQSELLDLNNPAPPTPVATPATPSTPATPATTPATPGTPATQPGQSQSASAVSVTFTAEAWTRITDATGRVLYQGTPPVGSVKGFPAGVIIRTGNAGGVSVSVNGAAKQPMGQSGQVLTKKY